MSESVLISVQITLVGMALVFMALILLWVLMELLVRITARASQPDVQHANESSRPSATGIEPAAAVPEIQEYKHRRQAAVLAVSLALAERDQQKKEFPLPPTAIVSAWQAVNRANMLNRRGQVR